MNHYFQELFYQANAGVYPQKRSLFYPLKHTLLQRYGTPDGWDRQKIVKICYRCDGTGVYVNGWGICDECWHCHHGVYSQRLIGLDRYKLGDYVYHVPRLRSPESNDTTFNQQIDGLIQHGDRFVVDGWQACRILLLRYAPMALLGYYRDCLSHWWRWRKYAIIQKCQRWLGQTEIDETPF